MRTRGTFLTRGYPLLFAAMFAVATVDALDTVPWDAFHDVLAWGAVATLVGAAVWPRCLSLRTVAVSLSVGALVGRLFWWWWHPGEKVVGPWYPTAVLVVLIAAVIVWAWTADYVVLRQRDGGES